MEQIFFLLLLAGIGLIRWILQTLEEKRNAEAAKRAAPKQQQPNAPVERAPANSEEERIRRFMEALGVPTTSAPPANPPPREVQPKKPREPKRRVPPIDPFPIPRTRLPEPPPVVTTPPPLVVVPSPVATDQPAPAPPPTTVVTAPVVTVQRTAPEFEVAEIDWQSEEAAQATSGTAGGALVRQDVVAANRSWAARLATPENLRDAIVLREIFGTPRGMHAAEDRSAFP